MEDMVGFGFRPTDVELVGYYLRNKILGKNELVERAINEVNICSFDPWDLPAQSKIKSRDRVWYFFSRRENKYASGNRQSRRTISGSGFWKLTGEHVDVKDQWGTWCGTRGTVIGQKRFLGFHRGKSSSSSSSSKGIKTDWVIHEYHYTLLPENQRTYVICRLEYNGDNMSIISANATDPTPTFAADMTTSAGSVVDQSLQGSYNTEYDSANHGQWFAGDLNTHQSVQGNSGFFSNFSEYDLANQWFAGDFNAQQQAPYLPPYGEESQMIWDYEIRENFESLVDERTYMQENRSDHRPKKPVSGFLADDSSDSDTDSMICGDDSSSTDSVASSNGPYHTPRDDILSSSAIGPLQDYVEPKQLKLQLQGNDKVIKTQRSECEWKMAQDLVKKAPSTTVVKQSWIVLEEMSQRKSQWNYLKNMLAGFLLFIFIIGWIILVG